MGVEPATLLLQSKVILPWLHYTEVCLYGIEASSVFWDPGKGSVFNPMTCGFWWWNPRPWFLWTRLILPWCVGMEVGPYTVGPPFMSTALLLDTNLLILVPVIAYVPAKSYELGLMISYSEAVVLFLASGSEDHEQKFNHHRRNTLSSTVLFLFCSSCLSQGKAVSPTCWELL